MKVKDLWTNDDFDEMGWHDSFIHSIHFSPDTTALVFEIDYLFQWILDEKINRYSFMVSPCTLTFESVSNLKINLDFGNNVGLDISDISRTKIHELKTGSSMWNYEVKTEYGEITFESTGFTQIVNAQPILSESQVLERK